MSRVSLGGSEEGHLPQLVKVLPPQTFSMVSFVPSCDILTERSLRPVNPLRTKRTQELSRRLHLSIVTYNFPVFLCALDYVFVCQYCVPLSYKSTIIFCAMGYVLFHATILHAAVSPRPSRRAHTEPLILLQYFLK